jgi:uncharacterized protein YceH (UPF0502 family)
VSAYDTDAAELRVLGCLIEKQRTTPDQYPLSLNALRLACNQSTSRDPVVSYDEPVIRDALESLTRRGWVRYASSARSHTPKYRHLFDDALGLSPGEISLLAVLMLRGAQTVNELKTRTERLHAFRSATELEETLEGLAGRELVELRPRRPGQREDRWVQLFGAATAEASDEPAPPAQARPAPPTGLTSESLEERVRRLEEKMGELLETIEDLTRGP